ncbi:hypothetical protein CAEBREN_28603 [Caenorhabditis brenneri]|uniref:Uncharacterized protein n=1 Tax=Caenorhabditis brenneri TaxID=135651 RepID=G0PB08_CAEBE|nr:hypothetical protein CAEBREN_28603 [Caenorhabditis brenneri]
MLFPLRHIPFLALMEVIRNVNVKETNLVSLFGDCREH